jgi:hypothetical protein
MAYYQRKASELLEKIEKAKAKGIPISEHGQEMKLVRDYHDAMVECAAKHEDSERLAGAGARSLHPPAPSHGRRQDRTA